MPTEEMTRSFAMYPDDLNQIETLLNEEHAKVSS